MKQPYILARTMKEAHEYARETLGLAHGRYRIINSPSTIKSVRGVELYLVPGWKNRFDRFAMQGAIRWTRMEVIDVEAQAEEPAPDGLNPPGVQQTLADGADPALVAEFEAFLTQGASNGDDMVSEGGPVAPEPEETQTDSEPKEAEGEVKRRRRRCKECGVLVEPDEVDQHAAEHLPTEG